MGFAPGHPFCVGFRGPALARGADSSPPCLPPTGCSLYGSRRLPWGPSSKHRPGAGGGRSAAVEAAGAGAAEDGLRSAQDAQLDGPASLGSRTRAHGFQLLGLPPPVPPPARTSLEKPEAFFPLPLLSWLNPGRVVGSLLKALGSRGGGGDPAGGLGVEAVCASFLHPSRLPAPDLGSALPLARCSWVTRSSVRRRKAVSMCSSLLFCRGSYGRLPPSAAWFRPPE